MSIAGRFGRTGGRVGRAYGRGCDNKRTFDAPSAVRVELVIEPSASGGEFMAKIATWNGAHRYSATGTTHLAALRELKGKITSAVRPASGGFAEFKAAALSAIAKAKAEAEG